MRALIRKELWVIHNFSHVFCELFQRVGSTYAIFTIFQIWSIINIDTLYAQYRMRSVILRNHLKERKSYNDKMLLSTNTPQKNS